MPIKEESKHAVNIYKYLWLILIFLLYVLTKILYKYIYQLRSSLNQQEFLLYPVSASENMQKKFFC